MKRSATIFLTVDFLHMLKKDKASKHNIQDGNILLRFEINE